MPCGMCHSAYGNLPDKVTQMPMGHAFGEQILIIGTIYKILLIYKILSLIIKFNIFLENKI